RFDCDWSSDVCSSDLAPACRRFQWEWRLAASGWSCPGNESPSSKAPASRRTPYVSERAVFQLTTSHPDKPCNLLSGILLYGVLRSEERRVGKEVRAQR